MTDDERLPEPTPRLSFRSRLTVAFIAASVLPLAAFGLVVLVLGASACWPPTRPSAGCCCSRSPSCSRSRSSPSYALATELTAPLRSVAAAVDRVSTGDLSTPIRVAGDDEFARLADSHNRLAADLARRNQELGRILAAIDEVSPRDDVEALVDRTVVATRPRRSR